MELLTSSYPVRHARYLIFLNYNPPPYAYDTTAPEKLGQIQFLFKIQLALPPFKQLFFMAELKEIATQIRRDIVRMVHGAASGHPGGSLGCADYFTALYFKVLKHNPQFNMNATNEDVFFLSNGHISPVFYSALARSGYFEVSELATFRKINSRLQGHPTTHEHLPGIRIASGSLGQGMSVAIGAALAKKLNHDYTYLANLFSEVQGTTIEHFIIAHKIERIKELIIYDELNITEIAHLMNYSSVSHLSNQFKKVTGLSPSHFKKLKIKRRNPIEDIGKKEF